MKRWRSFLPDTPLFSYDFDRGSSARVSHRSPHPRTTRPGPCSFCQFPGMIFFPFGPSTWSDVCAGLFLFRGCPRCSAWLSPIFSSDSTSFARMSDPRICLTHRAPCACPEPSRTAVFFFLTGSFFFFSRTGLTGHVEPLPSPFLISTRNPDFRPFVRVPPRGHLRGDDLFFNFSVLAARAPLPSSWQVCVPPHLLFILITSSSFLLA